MKKILLLLLALLLLVSCGSSKNEPNESNNNNDEIINEPKPEPEPDPTVFYSKLDGHIMENEKDDEGRILASMFDNAAAARWQAGLSKAAIVYEIRVESNATRYLGLFQTDENVTIGPVRSARPYFVRTVAEYDAIYAHFGGSTEGMVKIDELGIRNINGIVLDGSTYQRRSHKVAPHNAYTSLAALNSRADNYNYDDTNSFVGFNFYPKTQDIGGQPANTISINYGNNLTEYTYDIETQTYARYKDGQLHIDENDQKPLALTNIIIQYVNSSLAQNNIHKILDHIGSGTGVLISAGQQVPITWEKESETASTLFKLTNGENITLNPGQTWIQWIEETAPVIINE